MHPIRCHDPLIGLGASPPDPLLAHSRAASSARSGREARSRSSLATFLISQVTQMPNNARPARDEATEYYFKYIDLVPDDDIVAALADQLPEAVTLFAGISEEASLHRYAPDKWSIRQVLAHLNDTERLFAFRAFWFARGLELDLPSFDQEICAQNDGADRRSWRSLVEEFESLRTSSVSLFRHLPAEAWSRRGLASGNPFTVRALAYIGVGHVSHHAAHLRERYLGLQGVPPAA